MARPRYLLLALIGLAACSDASSTTAAGEAASSPAASAAADARIDGNVDVDGMSVFVRCEGEGEPTVVFEAGSDSQGSTDFPSSLMHELAATNRVCVYDRPGTGRSGSPTEEVRTVDDQNLLLHDLLDAAEIPGPYVLAGNSGGGILSIEFARAYGDDLAGLVLLDVPAPQADLDPDLIGVSPDTNVEHMDWVELEHRLAVDPPDLGRLPVVIVTATDGQSDAEDQSYWLALSSRARQVELEGPHAIQIGAPFEVAEEIRSLL